MEWEATSNSTCNYTPQPNQKKWMVAMVLTTTVTYLLLVFVFGVTTLKVWRGSAYKTILKIGLLMLGANLLYIINIWGVSVFSAIYYNSVSEALL